VSLQPGTHLGPYEIMASLGAGGMGEVYKAKDTRLDRFVAVKVLPEHLAQSADALARFEREAKEVLQSWTEDGKGLYVFKRGTLPTQIVRVDIATGRREPWQVFVPADPAGIRGITNFETTRDGRRVAFNYRRVLSQLFLVEGLK
jgi:hypothetical protein